jgi:hypothetical protein
MRSPWLTICDEFRKSINTASFLRAFDRLREQEPVLLAFLTPESLLLHQRSLVPGYEQTEAVILALVGAYQRGGSSGPAAGTLAFLAMEPGLTVAFFRARKLYNGDDDECAGQMCLAFFERLSRLEAPRTSRIAANLQRCTLRRVLEIRNQEIAAEQRVAEGYRQAQAFMETRGLGEISLNNLWMSLADRTPPYTPDEPEVEAQRRRLADELPLSPIDIELLLLRDPCRWSWQKIGGTLGMEPESARKRYGRLKKRWANHPFFQV